MDLLSKDSMATTPASHLGQLLEEYKRTIARPTLA
jgi:hypothetical protein